MQNTSHDSTPNGPTPCTLWTDLRSVSTLNSSARGDFFLDGSSGAPRRNVSVSATNERSRSSKSPSDFIAVSTFAESDSSAKAVGVGYFSKKAEMHSCFVFHDDTRLMRMHETSRRHESAA